MGLPPSLALLPSSPGLALWWLSVQSNAVPGQRCREGVQFRPKNFVSSSAKVPVWQLSWLDTPGCPGSPMQGSPGVCPMVGAGTGLWVSAQHLAAGWRWGSSPANSKEPSLAAAYQDSWKGFKAISSLFVCETLSIRIKPYPAELLPGCEQRQGYAHAAFGAPKKLRATILPLMKGGFCAA